MALHTGFLAVFFIAPHVSGEMCAPVVVSGIYNDMHDGDSKNVVLSGDHDILISSTNKTQTWKVEGMLHEDCGNTFNFDVPGKPNPPPKPIQGRFVAMHNLATSKLTSFGGLWSFEDDKIVNVWIHPKTGSEEDGRARSACVPDIINGVYDDMHDGDSKLVQMDASRSVTITSCDKSQKWVVKGQLKDDCQNLFNFNVPGKPNPPPELIHGEFVAMRTLGTSKLVSSGTLWSFSDGKVVNAWVKSNKKTCEDLLLV